MAGNAKSGERIFMSKCAQCHSLDKGSTHKKGLHLTGLFGRRFSASSCYSYCTANNNMPLVWEESTLRDYLLDSMMETPGTTMDCPGMIKAWEKQNLITQINDQKKLSPYVYSPTTYSDVPNKEVKKEPPIYFSEKIRKLIGSIRSFAMQGKLSEAFSSFSLLQHYTSNSVFFPHPISSLLSTSTNLKAISQGKQLHSYSISLGLHENLYIISRLSSFYSTTGLISEAKAIVELSRTKHAWPWNFLISAYVRNGFWLDAVLAYKKMMERGCEVDKFSYPSVISACSEIHNLKFGRVIHGSIEICGLQNDLFIRNALISMYARCGLMKIARQLFDCMYERDVVTWNSLISGYLSKGMWDQLFELLEKMKFDESKMNAVTWNSIATASSQMGSHLETLELIAQMSTRNASIDSVSLVIGLNSCSRIGCLGPGKEMHGLAFRLNYIELENVNNALITMYSRCKQLKVAYIIFRMSIYKSLITWNAVIAGFASGDLEEETFLVFREMIKSDIQPNYVTMMTILSLCARIANLKHGKELHCYITKHIFKHYQLLENSLIDMYSKSGKILVALKLFNRMSAYDVVTYTSMIDGYGMRGEGLKALSLFDEMISNGTNPDGITMVAVLSACGHSRLITQGKMLFDKMNVLYGVMPQMEHYSCMVDLYARAGLLRNAEEFINRMPFEPSMKILAMLVRACLDNGCIVIGEKSAMRLLEMRSEDQNHYFLIANMFLYCQKWDELSNVMALIKDMGMVKVRTLMLGLLTHIKDAGYVGIDDFRVLEVSNCYAVGEIK